MCEICKNSTPRTLTHALTTTHKKLLFIKMRALRDAGLPPYDILMVKK